MLTPIIPVENATWIKGPPTGQWTFADWEQLPHDVGNRYEIINGVLYVSTAPSYFHQWIIRRLDEYVGMPAERQGLAFAATAPVGVFMPGVDPVQADFVLVLANRSATIRDRHIHGIPDLIVEVISPGSKVYDEDVKLKAYAAAGVPEYAVVDPNPRELRCYKLDQPGQYHPPVTYTSADSITFACLPTITLNIADLFTGSPDTTL